MHPPHSLLWKAPPCSAGPWQQRVPDSSQQSRSKVSRSLPAVCYGRCFAGSSSASLQSKIFIRPALFCFSIWWYLKNVLSSATFSLALFYFSCNISESSNREEKKSPLKVYFSFLICYRKKSSDFLKGLGKIPYQLDALLCSSIPLCVPGIAFFYKLFHINIWISCVALDWKAELFGPDSEHMCPRKLLAHRLNVSIGPHCPGVCPKSVILAYVGPLCVGFFLWYGILYTVKTTILFSIHLFTMGAY